MTEPEPATAQASAPAATPPSPLPAAPPPTVTAEVTSSTARNRSGYQLKPVEKTLVFQESGRKLAIETVRALIALLALGLVIWTVYLGYSASQGAHWDAAKDWLSAVLPAETGILGSALGFYFGSNRRKKDL